MSGETAVKLLKGRMEKDSGLLDAPHRPIEYVTEDTLERTGK